MRSIQLRATFAETMELLFLLGVWRDRPKLGEEPAPVRAPRSARHQTSGRHWLAALYQPDSTDSEAAEPGPADCRPVWPAPPEYSSAGIILDDVLLAHCRILQLLARRRTAVHRAEVGLVDLHPARNRAPLRRGQRG